MGAVVGVRLGGDGRAVTGRSKPLGVAGYLLQIEAGRAADRQIPINFAAVDRTLALLRFRS